MGIRISITYVSKVYSIACLAGSRPKKHFQLKSLFITKFRDSMRFWFEKFFSKKHVSFAKIFHNTIIPSGMSFMYNSH